MSSVPYVRLNDPTRLVLFFLAVIGLYGSWMYTQSMPGADYYVAWTVADATRNDRGYSIYDEQDQDRMQEQYRSMAFSEGTKSRRVAFAKIPLFSPTASPFLYTTVNFLSTRNYETSLKVWNALSLAGFCAAILVFCHLLGYSRSASLVILVPCIFWMDAFQSDIRMANTNSFQLGLLALVYYLLSRDDKTLSLILAAAITAMLAFFKLNLAPIALLLLGAWLIRGQPRKFVLGLAGMSAGTIFAVVSSSLFFGGIDIWYEWLGQAFNLTEHDVSTDVGNLNAMGFLGLDLGVQGKIFLAAILCALTLFVLWWGRKSRGSAIRQSPGALHERDLIEYAQLIGMGCLVFMIVSPLVWLHYFVLAVPMLIVSLRPWSRTPAHKTPAIIFFRLIPILILLASLEGPHWMLMKDDYVAGRTAANVISIFVFFVLGLWQLRFQDPRLPARASQPTP